MKKTFTLTACTLLVLLFFVTGLKAQIPQTSPFPVGFFIKGEDGSEIPFNYVSTSDFGDTLNQTISAPIEWAHDDGMYDGDGDGNTDEGYVDSLACNWGTVSDLTGKIALIRRNACFFSQKIYNAQVAEAIGVIICNDPVRDDIGGMAGADSADVATIPSVFITFDDCLQIDTRIQNGEALEAIFKVSFSFSEGGPLTFGTPLSQVQPLEFIGFETFNPSETNTVFDVTASAVITTPSGSVTLSSKLDSIPPLTPGLFEFGNFTPQEIGDYTITFTNSLNDDVLTRNFSVTDNTFQVDNGNIIENTNGTIEPSDENFISNGLRYDEGTYYKTGPDGGTATFASFMISNSDELFTGDPESDVFGITLYDTDPDDDGVINLALTDEDLSNLEIAGFSSYILQENDQPFDLFTVPFDEPVNLKPNHQYLVMVQYDGTNSALGIPPKYAFAGTDLYPIELADGIFLGSDATFTDVLHPDGWFGNFNFVLRLHLEGFVVGTRDLEVLADSKVNVLPNPATDYVQLQLKLDNLADLVEVGILNIDGQLMQVEKLKNVREGTFNFDVANLAAGTYFLSIKTPEGWRSKKFIVLK